MSTVTADVLLFGKVLVTSAYLGPLLWGGGGGSVVGGGGPDVEPPIHLVFVYVLQMCACV